jgi:hypothetical protein
MAMSRSTAQPNPGTRTVAGSRSALAMRRMPVASTRNLDRHCSGDRESRRNKPWARSERRRTGGTARARRATSASSPSPAASAMSAITRSSSLSTRESDPMAAGASVAGDPAGHGAAVARPRAAYVSRKVSESLSFGGNQTGVFLSAIRGNPVTGRLDRDQQRRHAT